jgi:hypothetical protein
MIGSLCSLFTLRVWRVPSVRVIIEMIHCESMPTFHVFSIGLVLRHHHQFPAQSTLEDAHHEFPRRELPRVRQWRREQTRIHWHSQCKRASPYSSLIEIQENGRWLAFWFDGWVGGFLRSVLGCLREGFWESTSSQDSWLNNCSWQFCGIQKAHGQEKHRVKRAGNAHDQWWGRSIESTYSRW